MHSQATLLLSLSVPMYVFVCVVCTYICPQFAAVIYCHIKPNWLVTYYVRL